MFLDFLEQIDAWYVQSARYRHVCRMRDLYDLYDLCDLCDLYGTAHALVFFGWCLYDTALAHYFLSANMGYTVP